MRDDMTIESLLFGTTQIDGAPSSTPTSMVYLNKLSEVHLMIVLVRPPARRPCRYRARRVSVPDMSGSST